MKNVEENAEHIEQYEQLTLAFNTEEVPLLEKTDSLPQLNYSNIKSKQFVILFTFVLFNSCIDGLKALIMISYFSQYFGGCLQSNHPNYIAADCVPNSTPLTLYFTFVAAISIAIQFIFAAFIGRLTDSFGRKLFIIVPTFLSLILNGVTCFYFNILIYSTLGILSVIISIDNAIKTMISDTINPEQRNNAYGALTVASSIGTFIGLMFSSLIAKTYGNHFIFYVACVAYALLLIYIHFVIDETIDINNNRRQWNRIEFRNPMRPVFNARKNKLILWICVAAVPQTIAFGLVVTVISYIGTEMGLKDAKLNQVLLILIIIGGISCMLSNAVLLPFLQDKMSDINIMILCVSALITAFILFGSVSFTPSNIDMFIICVSAAIGGVGSVFMAIESGIISKVVHKEYQGTAFGILTAYKQIALIFGILMSGLAYPALDTINMRYIVIVIAILFLMVAVILISAPLRKALNKQYILSDKILFESITS